MQKGPVLDPRHPDSFEDGVSSATFQALRQLIAGIIACPIEPANQLPIKLKELEKFIAEHSADYLLMLTKGYNTLLHEVLNFNPRKSKNSADADWQRYIISKIYWIVSAAIEKRRPGRILSLLCAQNDNGHTVFHRALNLGDIEIVEQILSKLETNHERLSANLRNNVNNKRYVSCLHLAIKSKNPMLVKKMIDYLAKNEAWLQDNLMQTEIGGFTVLHEAVKNATPMIVGQIITLLLEPKQRRALEFNLTKNTTRDYTILHDGVANQDVKTLEKIVEILKQKKALLSKMLSTPNIHGMLPLTMAFQNGDVQKSLFILSLLQEDEDALEFNMQHLTPKRFSMLSSVIVTKSVVLVRAVLELLEKNPRMLAVNLKSVTQNKEAILILTIERFNAELCQFILSYLNRFPEIYKQNLQNVNEQKFSVLHKACLMRDEKLFWVIYQHLQRDRTILTKNLCTVSANNWTALLCAIKSNHLSIVKKIVEELKKDPRELKKQLAAISAEGSSVLHGAIMTDDPAILLEIFTLLNEYPQLLATVLAARTKDGYMTLQSAVFSQNEIKVSSVLSNLSPYPDLLTANLENVTNKRYNVLQTAIKTKNINIIREVFAALKASSALEQNVMHRDQFGRMALYAALEFADEQIVKEVLELLRIVPGALAENILNGGETNHSGEYSGILVQALKLGNEKTVAMLFTEVEHDESMMHKFLVQDDRKNNLPLLQALQSANLACLKIIVGYLRKYPRAAKKNIQNTNVFKYNCFQQAINSENLEIIHLYIEFCQEIYGSQARHSLKQQAESTYHFSADIWNHDEFIKILENYFSKPYGFSRKNKNDLERALAVVEDEYVKSLVKKLSTLSDRHYAKQIYYANKITDEFEKNAIEFLAYANSENQNNILHDVLSVARKIPYHEKLMRNLFSKLLFKMYCNLKFHFPVKMHAILLSRNAMGESLLESVLSLGNPELIKLILNQYTINRIARNAVINTESTSLLYRALQTADLNVLEMIISSLNSQNSLAVNILYRGSENNSCLHAAANSVDKNIAAKFLEIVKSTFPNDRVSTLQTLAMPHSNFSVNFWQNPEFNDLINDYIRFNPVSEDNTNTTSEMEVSEEPVIIENYLARAARLRREARERAAIEDRIVVNLPAATGIPQRITPTHGHIPMLHRIHGGIGQKYLGDILPKLPVPLKDPEQAATNSQTYEHTHVFKSLQKVAAEEESPIQPLQRETAYFKFSYYTTKKPVHSSECFTFVISGRLANASIPTPENGRCVLIFTAEEYKHVKPHLPTEVDVLVVHALSHCLGDNYTDLTGPTKRRLAVFYFTHHLKINQFLMVDDNLKQVKFNSSYAVDNTWDAFFLEMCEQARDYGCISVKTDSPKDITPGLLGSKLFCINMRKLREFLPETDDISLLALPPNQARKWGEDYYFQIMVHFLMNHTNQGYHIVSEKVACLDRKKSLINLAASRGVRATLFEKIDEIEQLFIEPGHIEKVHNTIDILNQIITENYTFYEKNRHHIENVDLLSLHAKANLHEWLPFIDFAEHPHFNDDFIGRLNMQIDQYLPESGARPYQADAIKSIKNMTTRQGRFKLTTGSGKTFQQSILAILAYHAAQQGQHIVIVVPHITLMTQFYRDCMEINERYIANNSALAIPNNAIITVSSHKQSCNVGALLLNRPIKAQKAILIICEDSFANLLELDRNYLQRIPMLLLDEYQLYPSSMANLLPMIQTVNPHILTLGSTATPPADDLLKPTLYRYHFLDGMLNKTLSPVVADSLGIHYSKNNVTLLMKCLPAILHKQFHPRFQNHACTLSQLKGIVYLPSIEDCEKAAQWLTAHNILNYCIHSKNAQHKSELQTFMNSDQPGVLLAVNMLKIGFSYNQLAWAIIGQGANPLDKSSSNKIKQMLGRVMRYMENKYGYVLAFDDVIKNIIKSYLEGQPLSLPFERNYLQAKQRYVYQDGAFQAVSVETVSNVRKDRITIIPSVSAPLLISEPLPSSSSSPEDENIISTSSSSAIVTQFETTRATASNQVKRKRIIRDPDSEDESFSVSSSNSSTAQGSESQSASTRRTRSRINSPVR